MIIIRIRAPIYSRWISKQNGIEVGEFLIGPTHLQYNYLRTWCRTYLIYFHAISHVFYPIDGLMKAPYRTLLPKKKEKEGIPFMVSYHGGYISLSMFGDAIIKNYNPYRLAQEEEPTH